MAAEHATPVPAESGRERRRIPRYDMALDIAFAPASVEAPEESRLERSVTVNLSRGGLCFYSDILYPLGAQIFCRVTFPGQAEPFDAIGVIAWFTRIEQDQHNYKLGIEFTELRPAPRAALEELLEHPPAAARSRSKRLLLVDDDEDLRLALKLRFESLGFEVLTAANGLEGLQKGRDERPDLIILDLMLPALNGYEVCRLLKFDQKYCAIPIILCTARSRAEDMAMGQHVGADAFITKPFDGKALIAKTEELLKR